MNIISISTKKNTEFIDKAITVLKGLKYDEINTNTFLGNNSHHTAVNQLKNLDEYKKDKIKCTIKIYHGSVQAT